MFPRVVRTIARQAWVMCDSGFSRTRWRIFIASLGVAGLDAQQRFGISAGVLSPLGVVQIAVCAATRVPVGVLLDRVGSRRMIVAGGLFMAGGQQLTATAGSLSLGLGCGDQRLGMRS